MPYSLGFLPPSRTRTGMAPHPSLTESDAETASHQVAPSPEADCEAVTPADRHVQTFGSRHGRALLSGSTDVGEGLNAVEGSPPPR